MTTDHDTKPRWIAPPWPGATVALLAAVAMVVASVLAWPEMAAEIVTREAGGRHGASVVGRGWSAAVLPVALLALTALFSVVPRLDQELIGRLPIGQERSPVRARRMLSWTLIGLSAVLGILHLGVLRLHTGAGFPEQAMTVGAGFLLVCLGMALPLGAPGGRFTSERAERFRAALGPVYRRAGFALIAVGVATVAASFAGGFIAMAVAVTGLLLTMAAAVFTALRAAR